MWRKIVRSKFRKRNIYYVFVTTNNDCIKSIWFQFFQLQRNESFKSKKNIRKLNPCIQVKHRTVKNYFTIYIYISGIITFMKGLNLNVYLIAFVNKKNILFTLSVKYIYLFALKYLRKICTDSRVPFLGKVSTGDKIFLCKVTHS